MKLSQLHLETIQDCLTNNRIENDELKEELFDHLCSVAEEKYSGEIAFDHFIENEISEVAPKGIKQLEIHTNYASYSKPFIAMKKITYTIGLLASISLSTGVLFKLMHWPGANTFLLIGIIMLFLVFVPYMTYEKVKSGVVQRGKDKVRALIGMISSIIIGVSVLFKFMQLMGANILFVIGMALFIIGYLPLFFINLYKTNSASVVKAE